MKVLIILFLAFFFGSGCAGKNGLFAPDALEQKALTYTRKAEIYNSLEIKASLVVTYLNPLLKEYDRKNNASFLVSVFIDNDSSNPKKQGLFNPDYTLTLNDTRPVAIKPLKRDDDLLKIAPVQNAWSKYYLVTFKKPASEKITLVFKSQRYGSSFLTLPAE